MILVKDLENIAKKPAAAIAPNIFFGKIVGIGRTGDRYNIKTPDGRTFYDVKAPPGLTPGMEIAASTMTGTAAGGGSALITVIGDARKYTDSDIVEVEV